MFTTLKCFLAKHDEYHFQGLIQVFQKRGMENKKNEIGNEETR